MWSISFGVLTVVALFFSSSGVDSAKSEVASAPPAPAFEIITSTGETFNNLSFKGRPAVLVFWAPWCKVCQRELPELAQFYQERRPAPLRMVSIGFADFRSNVEAFVKDRPEVFIFPNAYDEERWLAQTFRVNATPTYIVLDAQGRIALTHRGGGVLQNPRFQQFLSVLKG